ncbi:MAG: TetR/AcrR family transcriptional regulator [Chloroflexota bacterium]
MAVAPANRTVPAPSTRERILFVAADLFARQGFHATTTRQIADAVGIRQPSLFHHFSSKMAIAEAMLEWDLGRALPHVRAVAALPAPASARLFRYLLDDVRHLSEAPYNLAGLYTEEVISRPEFLAWDRQRNQLHDIVEAIVREGVATGEFIEVNTALVREAIGGILVRALTVHSGGRGGGQALADQVARLVVRGLLRDPSEIDEVQAVALALGV